LKTPSDPPGAVTDRPLRVVHVLRKLIVAGPELRVLNLVRELTSFTHVVVCVKKGPLYSRYAELCDVIHCPKPRGNPLAFFLSLTRALRDVQPDVVIGHQFGNHALVAYAAFLARVPHTFGVSTNDPVYYSGTRWWPMALAHLARPVCDGEIAVSKSVANALTSRLLLPWDRVTVIHNGCPVEKISKRADDGRRAPSIPRREGFARVFMAATFSRTKDHGSVVRAIDLLRRRGRNVELQFAGGSFREVRRKPVESLIDELELSDRVTILGVRNDIPELMGASDIVVHATRSEGFAMAVAETMAARVPLVASDIPACREALDGGRCGVLVPQGDFNAIADAIEKILDDAEFRDQIVDRAFERVSTHFDVRSMAAGYERLIRSRA
jgi:glycosyltransferase involved in cell wall biosynthesis